MKTFRVVFPYVTETIFPEDLELLLEKNSFDSFSETQRTGRGWSQVVPDARLLSVDGKFLLRYLHSQRQPDASAVMRLTEERIAQVIEAGREVSFDQQMQMQEQASNELIKYAPVSSNVVYLLICPETKLIMASGGTAKKCEDALNFLRKTLDSLAVVPWGDRELLTNVVTDYMTAKKSHYKMPKNLSISAFGKTQFTGSDSSLKIVLDGVQNDTDDAKNMLIGMMARSVEMSLIRRPDDGQIENLANFNLMMPQSGNIHFKKYDYDDDVDRDDIAQELISEMHLVSSYTQEILQALEIFMGIQDEVPEQD